MRQGFVKGKLHRASDIWPESCTKTRDLLHEKKWEKRVTEDEKLVRSDFERNDCLMKDRKAFFCASFLVCISNRKSVTSALQWSSVRCWWDGTRAITKIHEHFPMESPHKVCCLSQIPESVKQKPYKEKHLFSWV